MAGAAQCLILAHYAAIGASDYALANRKIGPVFVRRRFTFFIGADLRMQTYLLKPIGLAQADSQKE